MRRGEQPPWIVPDGLWQRIEPLLPKPERNPRHPGRKRIPDRQVLGGILFVLHTGIQWEFLPQQLGSGSGMTCWRRLEEWNRAGVWQRLHELLLAELQAAGKQVARSEGHDHAASNSRSPCSQIRYENYWHRRLDQLVTV